MLPFAVNRDLPTCLTLCLLFMAGAIGCQSTSIDATRDGRSTWRSQEIDLIPGGGRINVNVLCDSAEPITVVLLSGELLGEPETEVGPSCAAALGSTRNGVLLVRFRDLPVGEYMVVAFHDMNGDGRLVEKFSLIDSTITFTEPHSKLERFDLRRGDIINVSLDLETSPSDGDEES